MSDDRQDLSDETQQRNRTWMVVWTAVGALATAAGALFSYLELQDDESPRSEGRKAADPKQDVKRSPAPAALPRTKILLRNKYSQLCADVVGTGS